MTFQQYASQNPKALVRVWFKSDQGAGTLTMSAEDALNPCLSGRYFPPDGMNAADLGWPVPYWYAEEVTRIVSEKLSWKVNV